MQPSLFEKIQEQLTTFFSSFHAPVLAYSSVTALALFMSVLILRSPRLNHQRGANASPLFSEEMETSLNYASPLSLQEKIEPVTFDLKKKNCDSDSVVSPLCYTLKRKTIPSSLQHFE